jgi:hypothetical protein
MTEPYKCELCGEPMPASEQMFKFHGYSGPCPKPPLTKPQPKWVVHVIGPDDVNPQPDELTALREANAMNKFLAQRTRYEHDPFCIAVAKDEATEAV